MSTSSDRRNPVEVLAEEFLERKRQGEKPTLREYLDRHPELADEIRDLFPALLMMEDLGDSSGATTGSLAAADRLAVSPRPERLGDYRILREIGRGGMGVVYEAEQESLGRRVALKVLAAGALADPQQVRRFEREAKAAARLHHTNIVPVFGVGRQDGHHYFVMQFIPGTGLDAVLEDLRRLRRAKSQAGPEPQPIPAAPLAVGPTAAEVARSLIAGRFSADGPPADGTATEPLDGRDPAAASGGAPADSSSSAILPGPSEVSSSDPDRRYCRSVARIGIQAAEALDFAHRQGVLHRDVKPSNLLLDNLGNVWVADFGLAKTGEADDLTDTGDLLGTIRYMAPERFQGRGDARSDVYSLGLTLYELVALRPAFEAADRPALIERVLHEEPEGLKKRAPGVPRDLETIIAKASAREPAGRYATAGALAEDLRRFVEDRPIRARRVSAAERFGRWCRRNPAMAALAAVVAISLIVAAVSAGVAALQYRLIARQEVRLRNQAEDRAEAEARAKEELEASLYFHRIALAHRELSVDHLGRALELLDLCPESRRQWEWHYLKRLCQVDPITFTDRAEVNTVAFSPDGERLVSAGDDGRIRVRNSRTGEVLQTLKANTDFVSSVAFHPDGRHLASVGADGGDWTVKVWDVTTEKMVFPRPDHGGPIPGAYAVAFSPDHRRLAASGKDGAVNLWDWRDGRLLQTLPGLVGGVICVAFSPDGRRLASGSAIGDVMIWDAETGERLQRLSHLIPVSALAFSPDGRRLISAGYDSRLIVWDATNDQPLYPLRGHAYAVLGVAFSPDGRRLASCGWDKTVRVWEAATGREVLALRGHTAGSQCVAFSPDGRLASCGRDGTIRLWDATPLRGDEGQEALTFRRHANHVFGLAISPDGRRIASAGAAPTATGRLDAPVKVWDVRTGEVSVEFTGHSEVVHGLAWHPGGERIASFGVNAERSGYFVHVWDPRTGRPAYALPAAAAAVAFSPLNGRFLVTGVDRTVRVWDAQTGHEVGTLGAHDREIRGLAFSPDGRHLASASVDGTVKLWDATRLEEKQVARGTIRAQGVPGALRLAFSPDGRRLVAGGAGNTVRIWDVPTGRELLTLPGHSGDVWVAAFSPDPDGRWVASAGEDSTVKVWDSRAGTLLHSFRGHTGFIHDLAFSPDGRLLVSASHDRTVKVWDLTPLEKKLK
jgi:WD40 repeat protein/serine/threonine protein kinase